MLGDFVNLPSDIRAVDSGTLPLGRKYQFNKLVSYKTADGYFVVYRDNPLTKSKESFDSYGKHKREKTTIDGVVRRIDFVKTGLWIKESWTLDGRFVLSETNIPPLVKREIVPDPVCPKKLASLLAMLKPIEEICGTSAKATDDARLEWEHQQAYYQSLETESDHASQDNETYSHASPSHDEDDINSMLSNAGLDESSYKYENQDFNYHP